MKRHQKDDPNGRHRALEKRAEAAKGGIEMVAGLHAQSDPNIHVSSVLVFAALDAIAVRVFLAECGVDVSPDVDMFVGVVEKPIAIAALRQWECDPEWLAPPLPRGFVPLIALASDGAGNLVLCHTDVAARRDAYTMTLEPIPSA